MPAIGGPSPLGEGYPALGREIDGELSELVTKVDADHLIQRTRADATARRTFLLLPLGVFFSLLVLTAGLFRVNRAAGDRHAAQAALLRNNARLAVLHEIDQVLHGCGTGDR